jgi:hypothetical protein
MPKQKDNSINSVEKLKTSDILKHKSGSRSMNGKPQTQWRITEDREKEKPYVLEITEKLTYKKKQDATLKVAKVYGLDHKTALKQVNAQLGMGSQLLGPVPAVNSHLLEAVEVVSLSVQSMQERFGAMEEKLNVVVSFFRNLDEVKINEENRTLKNDMKQMSRDFQRLASLIEKKAGAEAESETEAGVEPETEAESDTEAEAEPECPDVGCGIRRCLRDEFDVENIVYEKDGGGNLYNRDGAVVGKRQYWVDEDIDSENINKTKDDGILHPDAHYEELDEWVLFEDCMDGADLHQTEPYFNTQAIDAYKKDLGTNFQRLVFREYKVEYNRLVPSRMVGEWDSVENKFLFNEEEE